MNTTIRKIGNSEGVIIPKEILEQLKLKGGDEVTLLLDGDNLRLVPKSSDLAEQIEAARAGMRQYHTALRELAK